MDAEWLKGGIDCLLVIIMKRRVLDVNEAAGYVSMENEPQQGMRRRC